MVNFATMNDVVLRTFRDAPVVTIGGIEVEAIFDARHYASEEGQAGGSDLITTISVRTIDLPATITDATEIVARGLSYRVWERRPDSSGFTTLQLERRD